MYFILSYWKEEETWTRLFRLFEDDEDTDVEDTDGGETEMEPLQGMSLDELERELLFWFAYSRASDRKANSLLRLLRRVDAHSVFVSFYLG